MSKTTNRILAAFFFVFIAGFFLLNLCLPDKTFSEQENRSLQTLPRFTITSLFSGQYTTRFETYCSDQFAGRNTWIEMKAFTELAQGKKQNNGVFFCDGGRLIESYAAPDIEQIQSAVHAVNSLCNIGIPLSLAIIPTAAELYADLLPDGAPNDSQSTVICAAYAQTTLQAVDLLSALSVHADEDIFYKTDHHWTSLGAYYAANALRSAWGLPEIDREALAEESVSDEFYGTLYSSSGFFWIPPDTMEALIALPENSSVARVENNGTVETLPLYNYDRLSEKDKYTFFLGGNIPCAVVETGTENSPSLLILRDSYADSLVPFLTDSFSDIHLIDLRYYTGSVREYITAHKIDRVLVMYSTENFCADTVMRIY